jgi:hypothetical protein
VIADIIAATAVLLSLVGTGAPKIEDKRSTFKD